MNHLALLVLIFYLAFVAIFGGRLMVEGATRLGNENSLVVPNQCRKGCV